MAFFYYDSRSTLLQIVESLITAIVPDDIFHPKEHSKEELDAMLIPMDRRDGCANNYAEFKKCIMVQH